MLTVTKKAIFHMWNFMIIFTECEKNYYFVENTISCHF